MVVGTSASAGVNP